MGEHAHSRLIERWRQRVEDINIPQDKLNIKIKLKAEFETEIQERKP